MKKNTFKHSKLMVSLMLIPTVLGTVSTTGTALADNVQQRPTSESATQQKTAVTQSGQSSASNISSATSNNSQSNLSKSTNKTVSHGTQSHNAMRMGAMQSNRSINTSTDHKNSAQSSSSLEARHQDHNSHKASSTTTKHDGTKIQFEYKGQVINVSDVHLNNDGSISDIYKIFNKLPSNLRDKYDLASLTDHKLVDKNGTLIIPLVENNKSTNNSASSSATSNSSVASNNSSQQSQSTSAKYTSQSTNSNVSNDTNKVLANRINQQLHTNYHKTTQSNTVNTMAQKQHRQRIQRAQYKRAIAHAVYAEHQFERRTARTRSEMMPTPRRYVTPLPSRRYTIHRTHVSNPMFLTNHAYRHYAHMYHGSSHHFTNTVRMTKATEPSRDMSKVKPFKGFDKSVLRYKPYLDKVCKHYHMQKYEILFLAIMENETRGHGSDVMQSSESVGMSPGSLSPQQSIEQAVKYMKSIVQKAQAMDRAERRNKHMKPADYHDYSTDSALLAQTYNYGAGFLDYVSKSKDGYNVNVAQKYSKDVVAPRLGNSKGSTYTYDNPIAKMYHKTFLYTNGGNYFYGPMVEQYMTNGTFMHQILQHLIKYAGQKYVFGGKNPQEGFDCSGIVSYGFKLLHVDLPSYTVTQWHDTKPVKDINSAKPGDLIFFKGTYGSPNFISHVELVVDRDTMFGSDGSGVGFHDIHQPYWNKHFAGIRRVPQANKLNKQARSQLEKEVKSAVNNSNN